MEISRFVHFERWSLGEKIEMAKRRLGLDVGGELGTEEERLGDERAREGKWWEAVWWWRMAGKVEMGMGKDVKGEEYISGRDVSKTDMVDNKVCGLSLLLRDFADDSRMRKWSRRRRRVETGER